MRTFEAMLGDRKLRLDEVDIGANQFRAEIDGKPRVVRVSGDVGVLGRCLDSGETKRDGSDGVVEIELNEVGLSGYDATLTAVIRLDREGAVAIDVHHQVNEINPHIGW